jgi:hypothetical protein
VTTDAADTRVRPRCRCRNRPLMLMPLQGRPSCPGRTGTMTTRMVDSCGRGGGRSAPAWPARERCSS